MNIGILGTGTIASSLVTGFCTDAGSENMHFFVSPRNAKKAAALKAAYPGRITICEDNQTVVDQAEWVFLTVIPRDAQAILSKLSFRPNQKILSIMSDYFIEKVRTLTGPVSKIIRMVPLPFAAMHIGPIAYYPADDEIAAMFAPLGQGIVLNHEDELSIISGLTGLMSVYYMLLYETTKYGTAQGLPSQVSIDYMTSFYEALCIKARAKEDGDIYGLASEMTPGGLSEMALKSMLADDGYQPWITALDKIMERLGRNR